MLLEVERRQAVAILEAFAPPREDEAPKQLAPKKGEVDYLRAVTRMMAASTGKARLGIHVALLLVALAPLWLCGKLATMAGLALEQRTAILERLARHPFFAVRDLTLLLKLGAAFALLGTASVRARSQYDRPLVEATASAASSPTSATIARGVEPRRVLPLLTPGGDRTSKVA
jgi:hypothetical protein